MPTKHNKPHIGIRIGQEQIVGSTQCFCFNIRIFTVLSLWKQQHGRVST